jgi:hypothetical protein
MGVGGQRHTPAVLRPGKTRYTLYRRLGEAQAYLTRPTSFVKNKIKLIKGRTSTSEHDGYYIRWLRLVQMDILQVLLNCN